MLPQHGRQFVRCVLQDGRQLEGELMILTGRYQIGDTLFYGWEIDELDEL